MQSTYREGNRRTSSHSLCLYQLLVFSISLVLLGCASVTPEGYVAKTWGKSFRELGINPIFPPRENVQVGDIFVLPLSPEDAQKDVDKFGYAPTAVWADSLDLDSTLDAFYGKRNAFPSTVQADSDEARTNDFHIYPEPTSTNSIYTSGEVKRLRTAGFPGFFSATFTRGDLSALIPVEGLNVMFGTAFEARKSVTVTVNSAETCSLPYSEIATLLFPNTNYIGHLPSTNYFGLAPEGGRYSKPGAGSNSSSDSYVYVAVLNEVYYARTIDISVQSSLGSGSQVSVQPIGTAAITNIVNSVSTVTTQSTPGAGIKTNLYSTTISTNTAPEDPAAFASRLNQSLNANSWGVPGGSMQYITTAAGGLGMRKTFEFPMAIGYRAVLLRVYQDGHIDFLGSYESGGETSLSVRRHGVKQ